MGRKGTWLRAVKRVFSVESKGKESKAQKFKKWEPGKSGDSNPCSDGAPLPPAVAHQKEVKLVGNEQSKQAYPVALATAKAAEAAVAAAEVVRHTNSTKLSGKSREEVAAIKIQTAFRGYLAKRALRALRGLVRLKLLIQGNSVKRQAASTLRCMQTLARVQSQIRSRRIRMSEENQALQRQLLLNREIELEKLKMGAEWDDSLQSKEQIEASLLSKHEAAIRRERAMAYAFSHQWKISSRLANPLFTDPNNPQWGWSWLERWMAARPWESWSMTDNDHYSAKSASFSVVGEINKAYVRPDTISSRPSPVSQKSSPANCHSPATPPTKTSSLTQKIKSASPKASEVPSEDDSRSILSLQSEQYRQHGIAGSSVRDDESLASSPAVPSYMAPTRSARAKSRFSPAVNDKNETPEKESVGSVKKRLSFPVGEKHNMSSPARARRHSGPPKVDIASVKGITIY